MKPEETVPEPAAPVFTIDTSYESGAYEYRGLMAELWDVFRGDTSAWEDRFFYLDVVREFGPPVLDVGCGSGRILLDYLQQGIDIDGVDNSPEMLDICRQKAALFGLQPGLYQQAMESLDLPRRYRTILVPSSTFQLVLEPAAARQVLRRFYDHLLPGGALAMSAMLFWKEGDPLNTGWWLSGEVMRASDGALARRWSHSWFEPEARLEHTEERYEIVVDGAAVVSEIHRRSPATTWYTQAQLTTMLTEAGFGEIRLHRGFTAELATPEDTLFVAVARRIA
jgi:SAM-dependent methyltransferase